MDNRKLEQGLSIGALARATGLGVERIRMWERRYGSPKSIRRPSGHRRYPVGEIERLRALKQAITLGFRPGDIATASLDEIKQKIDSAGPEQQGECQKSSCQELIAAAKSLDGTALSAHFHNMWAALGPLRFLTECSRPFLQNVGEAWSKGQLSISEEHFASEHLADFLSEQWRRLNERAPGPPFLLANLPGDSHTLGLEMCAAAVTVANCRVVFLGPSTPIAEIVQSTRRTGAPVLCLSISSTMEPIAVLKYVEELIDQLPSHVRIICGGNGSHILETVRKKPKFAGRLELFDDFMRFFDYVSFFCRGSAAEAHE